MTAILPSPRLPEADPEAVRLSEVVAALSYALDITEGQPMGHAVRTCLIGMRIGAALRLDAATRSDLFYALLLKDLGCSSNAARLAQLFGTDDLALKRAHKLADWADTRAAAAYAFEHVAPGRSAMAKAWHVLRLGLMERGSGREMVATRCERGADIALMLGLTPRTAEAIRALDELWDGRGMPRGLQGDRIPLLGRICGLAQTVDVFVTAVGRAGAYEVARARRGTWFDPALVEALGSFEHDRRFWGDLGRRDARALVAELEPEDRLVFADAARLDRVAEAFARVIDAKSPFTARHSEGVAAIAVRLADALGLTAEERTTLRRAGLLHDIGKLGVSNTILDKPGRLTEAEFAAMREHPRHTAEILLRVRAFRGVADVAARHHERLDGQGYHQGIGAAHLTRLDRVLAVADVCEALSAARPYRPALPRDEVLALVRGQAGAGLCAEVVEVAGEVL